MENHTGRSTNIATVDCLLTFQRLEGILLLVPYVIIAVAAWYVKVASLILFALILHRFYPESGIISAESCPR